MINNVNLTGRLTRDIELKYTQSGEAVASFTLAVSRNYTNKQGEREADFINCVIWRKSAEALAQHTSKGTLIGITGRIQTRNYENEHGQRIYITEVVASEFSFLESKKQAENNGYNAQNVNTPNANQNGTQPAYSPQQRQQTSQWENTMNTIEVQDSDLPF